MARNIYGFEKNNSQKVITVFEIVLIAILAVMIIAILVFNFMFKKDGLAPDLFGYKIYLSTASTMGDAVPNNSAVFAKTDLSDGLEIQDVVLINVTIDNINHTTISRIVDIQEEDGTTFYVLKGDAAPENQIMRVPESAIIAHAEKYDKAFGKLLIFATSKTGIMLAIIIPSILIILLQVLKIIKVNRMQDYDGEDDNFNYNIDNVELENEKVVFSTLKSEEEEDSLLPPVRKMYVNNSGKADFHKSALPTADVADFEKSVKTAPSQHGPIKGIPSEPSRSTVAKTNSIYSHFSQKPTDRSDKAELSSEFNFETKKPAQQRYDGEYNNIYEHPVRGSLPPVQEVPLAPPVISNPVDITIPSEAVKPKETIAPPPKQTNNKTLEELMKVIDQAQSGLKK